MTISTDYLHYDKETKTFSAEVSEIPETREVVPTDSIFIKNPKTGKCVKFVFTHRDMDSHGEEIYGWNYKNWEMGLSLLLIND